MKYFICLLILVTCFSDWLSGQEQITLDTFLSPEYMCASENGNLIYIGLSTYPGIVTYRVTENKIEGIIPTSDPVRGIVLDSKRQVIYAALQNNESEIEAIDISSGKGLGVSKVGYHPEDIVISPRHDLLFSANRFGNSVSFVELPSGKELVELITGREPVALALSPDESTLAVAHLLPEHAATDSYVGAKLSLIDIASKSIKATVQLPKGAFAVKDLLFSNDGKYLYASHLIGRFNVLTSQIEKGWINTNAISIIEFPSEALYTSVLLDDIYKGAANPSGMALSEDGKKLLVCISGTHELFEIDRDQLHNSIAASSKHTRIGQAAEFYSPNDDKVRYFQEFSEIKQMDVRFSDLSKELGFMHSFRKRIPLSGKGPAQVLVSNGKAIVSLYYSDKLEVIDLDEREKSSYACAIGTKKPEETLSRLGELLFHDANNCFQQWQSCSSCHPGGGRTDGLNWDLLNDGIGNPKNTKSLLFAHRTPPAMATGIRKDAETAVRAGFKYIQFFDVPESSAKAVDEYLKSLQAVPSPYLIKGVLNDKAQKGRDVYVRLKCSRCHSGNEYTNLGSYEMGVKGKYDKQNTWDTPGLKEVWRTAPYMHDGAYYNLTEVFEKERHGIEGERIDKQDLDELIEYLYSL